MVDLHRRTMSVVGAVVAVWIPVLAAIQRVASLDWSPTGDLAQADLRFIDFWAHPPLVGAAGRIVNDAGVQGNHPGPLMFYASWPIRALFGGSGTAFAASTAILNGLWLTLAVCMVWRLIGSRVAWFGVIVACLIGQWGLDVLTQLWNPWAALAPFLTGLVAAWWFLAGGPEPADTVWARLVGFPCLVFSCSYCVQCHVGYVVPAILLCGGSLLARGGMARLELAPWRRSQAWMEIGAAGVLGVLCWVPPVLQQLRGRPGNLGIIWDYFTTDNPRVGLGSALGVVVGQLDPTGQWLVTGTEPRGNQMLGAMMVLAWLAAVIWSVKTRHRLLIGLHGVVGLGLLASVLAVAAVFGEVFLYLFRWVSILTAMAIFATGGALVTWMRPRLGWRWKGAVAGVVLCGLTVSAVARIERAEVPYRFGWRTASLLGPELARGLAHQHYFLDWDDPVTLGGVGFGILGQLARAGFEVGVNPSLRSGVESERTLLPEQAEARLVLVTGRRVNLWKAAYPDAMVASVDPRSSVEVARVAQLVEELAALGLSASELSSRPYFAVVLDPTTPEGVRERVGQLIDLGDQTAAFVIPIDAPWPPASAAIGDG